MLASRGAEYTSRESPGVVQDRKSNRYGMGFHHHCGCLVIDSYFDADLPNLLHDLRDESQTVAGWETHPDLTPEEQRGLWKHHVSETRPSAHSVRETPLRGPARERTAENDAYWAHRQRALGIDDSGTALEPHEIELVEALKSIGDPPSKWLPVPPPMKDGRIPASNDMMWHGKPFEAKRTTSANYAGIKGSITQYVKKALETGVTKDRFIIDLGDRAVLSEKVRRQVERYNIRNQKYPIKELWVFDRNGLHQVNLIEK